MLVQLSRPHFIASLREDRTHRPTTNLHRRSLDDFNHSFEWSPGVLSFVTNPQMKNPFEVFDNNAFAEWKPACCSRPGKKAKTNQATKDEIKPR